MSDVNFLNTSIMPAFKPPQPRPQEQLIIKSDPPSTPFMEPLNQAINNSNLVVFADIHGEHRISRVLKRLPDGKYQCMAFVTVGALIIR